MATNVNANKTFYSRFQMKYDTYENWITTNPVLLAGEIAIATIAVADGATSLDHNSVPLPQVLIKIGDGTSTYTALPFISAKAADVYEWAKAATKPSYDIKELTDADGLNKEYRINKTNNTQGVCYRLQERTVGTDDTAWTDVSYVADETSGTLTTVDIPDLTSDFNDLATLLGQLPTEAAEHIDFATWIAAIETKVDDHEKYVGEFTHNTAKTVVEYIDAKVAEVAGDADTNLEELQTQVNALEEEVGNPSADEEPATGLYEIIETEVARATGVEGTLAQDIEDLTKAIDNLSNIMNFRGAFTATTEVTEPKAGDVIVIKASETTDENGQPVNAAIVGKEYVYDGTEWIELGDTTAEQARLSAIEERVTETETAIGYPTTGEGGEGTGLYREIELEKRRALEVEGALDERITVLEEATTDIADLVQEKGYITFNAGSATEVI